MSEDVERALDGAAYGRRTFLRRLVVGSAFAVPVVSSFSMAGINAVSAHADPTNPALIGNCNSTVTAYNVNSTGPIINCGNQTHPQGIVGLLEEIFELFTHPNWFK